jgi:hypothetical protein
MDACGIWRLFIESLCGMTDLGLCSEKIPRNRLERVSVVPRKKVLIPRHSGFRARADSEAWNGTEWNDCLCRNGRLWTRLTLGGYKLLKQLSPHVAITATVRPSVATKVPNRLEQRGFDKGRIQSCVLRLPKYWPPTPLSTRRVFPPPTTKAGDTHSPGREGGGGVNILEDERHRIGLLQ